MKTLFIIIGILAFITLLILWNRWNMCKKKYNHACNFFTGKPTIDNVIPDNETTTTPGIVDLWCENGKYYKRTSTAVYGKPDMLELTKAQFDALVAQGISYSGCPV